MCSALSLRKQVSTCSAEQSQRLLLGRLKSDFHYVTHFLAAQTGISRARALGGAWMEITFGEVGAQAYPESTVEKLVLLSTSSLVEGYGQPPTTAMQGHTTIPLLLCSLSLAAFFIFWSSRVEAGNCANDTHQLIEAMQGTPNSKYAV